MDSAVYHDVTGYCCRKGQATLFVLEGTWANVLQVVKVILLHNVAPTYYTPIAKLDRRPKFTIHLTDPLGLVRDGSSGCDPKNGDDVKSMSSMPSFLTGGSGRYGINK